MIVGRNADERRIARYESATHRSFGVPAPEIVEKESEASQAQGRVTMGQLLAIKIDPTGELPEPQQPFAAMEALNKKDGFEMTEIDGQIAQAHGTQMTGHFLIDREGIIRWEHIECAERLEDLSKFPSDDEILRAARSL